MQQPSDPQGPPSGGGDYPSGSAFFVGPVSGERGPGLLLLHSWWGLTEWLKDLATSLADEGFSVLAPDLLDGVLPSTPAEGELVLRERSPDEMSALVLSSAEIIQRASDSPDGRISVVGFSMGGSLALWLAARRPSSIARVVTFYGAQSIDFDHADVTVQGHFGDRDHLVSEEDRVLTESFLQLGDNDTEFHVYPHAQHWFFEPGPNHDPEAAALATERMLSFLRSR